MSWKASAYIRQLRVCSTGEPLTTTEKCVAMMLADYFQDRGDTFPSVETLAEDSAMLERSCRKVLASLERKGVIIRVRPAVQYRGVTTSYKFPGLDKEDSLAPLEGDKEVHSGTLPDRKGVQKGVRTSPHNQMNDVTRNYKDTAAPPPAPSSEEDQLSFALTAKTVSADISPLREKGAPVKPLKTETPADPRFAEFVAVFSKYHKRVIPGETFVFTGIDGKQLKRYLQEHPFLRADELARYIANREKSAGVNHAEPPATVLSKIDRYRLGPLNEFGRPMGEQSTPRRLQAVNA